MNRRGYSGTGRLQTSGPVVRVGAGWGFGVGKYLIVHHPIHDFADVRSFRVFGAASAGVFEPRRHPFTNQVS